ncbi:PTPDL family protein [Rubritalea spongiae]|uniref:PTPDL family protein n=1 Tax=Rubritalea spongiae TaxID=430797 RepID=A0ABW5E8V8_9BACT
MIKNNSALALLTGITLVTLSSANAEIFTLKNGDTHNGKISYQTEDTYYLLVEVKPGIRNEIAVKKSDVESIKKEDTSGDEYEKLSELTPTPDLLSEQDYQRAIENQIDPFLRNYPTSRYRRKVKEIRETLLKELELVKQGAVKLNGKFLSEDEQSYNSYEIDAYLALKEFKTERNLDEAFEQFENLEEKFLNTKPFKAAIKHAAQLISQYEKQARSIIANSESIQEKRDTTLDRLPPSDRARVRQSLAEEERIYQAKLTRANDRKSKWLPLNRFHPETAEKAISNLEREKTRIKKLSQASSVDAGELYRSALSSLDKIELDKTKDILKELRRADVPDSYIDPINEQLELEIATQKELNEQRRNELAEAKRKLKEQLAQERAEQRKAAQIAAEKKRKAEEAAEDANLTAEEKLKKATGLGIKEEQVNEVLKQLNPTSN